PLARTALDPHLLADDDRRDARADALDESGALLEPLPADLGHRRLPAAPKGRGAPPGAQRSIDPFDDPGTGLLERLRLACAVPRPPSTRGPPDRVVALEESRPEEPFCKRLHLDPP